jgi:OPA family glycerol-3-phosphate transporter-like MFS transporter
MIQLGAIGAGQLGRFLATGFAVPLLFFTITVPKLDWRYMFFVPPAVVVIIVILMNALVKNHPEEAGYRIVHDDEDHGDDPHERLHLRYVFVKITSNPIVWIVAMAYFCTGFVRRAIESWWVVYLLEAWGAGKESTAFAVLAWGLPATAFLGSLGSGIISDRFVSGRRAPVATCLYLGQAAVTAIALVLLGTGHFSSVWSAVMLLIGISVTCNATHSILGTAAAMDLGGRKMAGFAAGVIDSFQYFGAMLAGSGLGRLLRTTGGSRMAEAPNPATAGWDLWFASMLPFGLLGAGLMGYLWFRHRGSGRRGT